MMRRLALVVIGACLALTVGAAGGVALAWFTTTGSGSGTASVATSSYILSVETVTTATPSAMLTPGASADLVVRVRNDNATAVTITGLSQDGAVVVVDGGACTAANAAVSVAELSGLSIQIPATTTLDVHVPTAVAMGATADNGCQGKSFQIPVVLVVAP